MLLQRFISIILILCTTTACNQVEEEITKKLVVGVVGYGESNRSLEQYAQLQDYLSIELKSIVELEPAYNEIQAKEQISRKNWDIVFASPGLAAIAISRHEYLPLVSLEGIERTKSAIVVNDDSNFQNLKDLSDKSIALGQEGSATSYYLPIYNLYGLRLQKVLFSPTPQTSLQWLEQSKIDAAALSLQELNQYRRDFSPKQFRILQVDSHTIPAGAILVSDNIDEKQYTAILDALVQAPSHIAASAQFLPNEKAHKYEYLIEVIEKVTPISDNIKKEPALFYEGKQTE